MTTRSNAIDMAIPMPARRGLLFAALLVVNAGAWAQTAVEPDVSALMLPGLVSAAPASRAPAPDATVQIVVRLTDAPLAVAAGANAKRSSSMTIGQRAAYMAMLQSKQDALSAQVTALGATETSRVSKVLNAVVFSTKASTLPEIQRIPGVASVRPVGTYQLMLAETVPYIGAATLQTAGVTGAGIKVAVLDSGIDYTHKNLGGSGTLADYATAIANPAVAPAGLYPTAKVIGGYDFVGTQWPNAARTQDPNPIDEPPAGGHGTHVADIIGGKSIDGTHKGVAPDAQLYAVKVCSNQSSSCNGEALILGMDWILDPNGDLDFSDAPDVVNLSLGSSYGQREDDLTLAVSNAVRFGIVAAVSAGNSADRPYIAGSPSTAPEAISVAQTQVPSALAFPLVVTSPAAIAGTYRNTATMDWAPVDSTVTGQVAYVGRGCNVDTYLSNPTGKVALIDRGACNISEKVKRASDAGAIGVLIGLVAAGDASSFSNGGDCPTPNNGVCKPSLVIQQSLSNSIKANIAAPVVVNYSNTITTALAGSIVASSSRGPSYSYNQIKPEIGAPGASLSAEVGTGTGQTTFGGTSGAAPMVAGSAALLLQKFPTATPSEIKSRLMNGANTNIFTNPATSPGELAPITRIGAGEVQVDRSAGVSTGLWDASNPYNVGLSFGTLRVSGPTTLQKKVAVRNYSSSTRTYTIARSFRYANDAASGAVTLSAPASITVPGYGTGAFTLTMTVNASLLPTWNLGAASSQGTGGLLQGVEFDGYVSVSDTLDSVSVPWHVLPHKSANVVGSTSVSLGGTGAGTLSLSNVGGATAGLVDVYALTGTSPQISTVLNPAGSQDVLIDLKAAGVRPVTVSGALGLQFAVSTYGQRSHPAYPAEIDVYVDSNNDGVFDYVMYTAENGTFASSGQTVVAVQNLSTNATVVRFFANADLSSSNMVLTALASDIGITSGTQKFRFSVLALDNYFTGVLKDSIVGMTHTLDVPKYALAGSSFNLGVGVSGSVAVSAVAGGDVASPSQTGFLLQYRDGKAGREADLVTVTP
jgi:subtilisin family serine protease